MKRVQIGKSLTTFAGIEITDTTKEGDDKRVYVRDMLVQQVGQLFQAEDKNRAILAYKTAQKIFDCKKDFIDLEDAEHKICIDALDPKRLSPMVYGQLVITLEEEAETPEKKPTKK